MEAKYIPTFESFLNTYGSLDEAYGPAMIDKRGVFDDDVIDWAWEDAATWAYGKNLGLKSQKEIENSWNTQLDDRNSDLFKEVVSGLYSKGVSDISRSIRDAGATPESIRDGIKYLGDRLSTLSGIFAGADKSPGFAKLQKEALAYADKLEKDTPLEPIKIDIMPGTFSESKGIKAKDYYEAGTIEFTYDVIVVMKDGRAMKGSALYASENEVGSNAIRLNGNDLAKQKEFIKKYQKAVDNADAMATSFTTLNSVKLIVIDNENTFKGNIKKADAIIKNKIIPALKKEFTGVEVNF